MNGDRRFLLIRLVFEDLRLFLELLKLLDLDLVEDFFAVRI